MANIFEGLQPKRRVQVNICVIFKVKSDIGRSGRIRHTITTWKTPQER